MTVVTVVTSHCRHCIDCSHCSDQATACVCRVIVVRFPARGKRFFNFMKVSGQALGPTRPFNPGVLLGLKRPGPQADHSSLSDVEVKEGCIHTSTSPYMSLRRALSYLEKPSSPIFRVWQVPAVGLLGPSDGNYLEMSVTFDQSTRRNIPAGLCFN